MNINDLRRTFSHMPVIETERLFMRRMNPTDSSDMYEYACQEQVTRYLLWYPHSDRAYTKRYLEHLQGEYRRGDFYDWAVVYKAHRKMIGTCGFTSFDIENGRAEIGYVLNPAYWGQGCATEAVKAVLYFGFYQLGLNRIEARYMVGNDRSRHIMEKCGMTFEGVHRSLLYVKGVYRDIGTCAILADEYIRSHPEDCPDAPIITRRRLFDFRGR
ncbi:MAG: GNAT family N-acetyltransferase [Clostridiales bacterium]|nr:GNAT family N-acetyltransferase [Clostridiales bacterium]